MERTLKNPKNLSKHIISLIFIIRIKKIQNIKYSSRMDNKQTESDIKKVSRINLFPVCDSILSVRAQCRQLSINMQHVQVQVTFVGSKCVY